MTETTGLLLENYDRDGYARVVGLQEGAMAIGVGQRDGQHTVRYYLQTSAGVEVLTSEAAEKKDPEAFAAAAASQFRVIGRLMHFALSTDRDGKARTMCEHRDMGDGLVAIIRVAKPNLPDWALELTTDGGTTVIAMVVEGLPYIVSPMMGIRQKK